MLELGVPNHAYDLALVPGGVLRTRRARDGERLVTLDGAERVLVAGEGLIVDRDDRPIGVAGVMGGSDTELNEATTDVLLEAAWWDPASITRATRRLQLFSEASRRFARGTDPGDAAPPPSRATPSCWRPAAPRSTTGSSTSGGRSRCRRRCGSGPNGCAS